MLTIRDTQLQSLPLLHRGKVRDVYALGDDRALIVTTDRLSAFDVVLPDPVPGKGRILTSISNFWFARTAGLMPNHATAIDPAQAAPELREHPGLTERSVIVTRARPLPMEAVVRGYLIGSGWRDYQRDGGICGIGLPDGLQLAQQLPRPIFTPSTKAQAGAHDANITFDEVAARTGRDTANRVREAALALYQSCAAFARERGIIIADTKFEFGHDDHGNLLLIDEALTPDSSRFWDLPCYRPGENPPNFDKQFVRDHLEKTNWNRRPPAPRLPDEIIRKTTEKYRQIEHKLLDG